MTRAMARLLAARDHLAVFHDSARRVGWLEGWVLRNRRLGKTPLHLLSPAQLRFARRRLEGWRAAYDPAVRIRLKRDGR